jgi:hypothetical protein
VLEHGLGVEVGDQEGDVVALDGLPPEDDEVLGALGQEAHELLAEDGLELVGLLNADGNSARHQDNQHTKQHTSVSDPTMVSRVACTELFIIFSFLFHSFRSRDWA